MFLASVNFIQIRCWVTYFLRRLHWQSEKPALFASLPLLAFPLRQMCDRRVFPSLSGARRRYPRPGPTGSLHCSAAPQFRIPASGDRTGANGRKERHVYGERGKCVGKMRAALYVAGRGWRSGNSRFIFPRRWRSEVQVCGVFTKLGRETNRMRLRAYVRITKMYGGI